MAETSIKPRRRWPQFSLRTLFVLVTACAVVLAMFIGFVRWCGAMIRKNDRAALGDYIVNGTLENPEALRGRGLFSDAELDALKAESKRRSAGLPPNRVIEP